MIVIENVTMYKCEFCSKKYYRKQDINKHEFNCSRNPKNFSACENCIHLENIKIEYTYYGDVDEYQGPTVKQADGFFCKKLEKKLYPFKAAKRDLPKKYPDTFKDQIQMPCVCEFKQEPTLSELLNGY